MGPSLDQWVIYFNPSDHPGMFVVRRWMISSDRIEADSQAYVCDTLNAARGVVAAYYPDGFNLGRQPEDDPVIVEVWT